MSQQSADTNELGHLVLLLGFAACLIAAAFFAMLVFSIIVTWAGFTLKYPRSSAHVTMWALMGISMMAGFGLLVHYIVLWDVPPFRAFVIAGFITLVPAFGLYWFINVPTGDNLIFRSMKMTIPFLALIGFGYWLLNGAGAVYDAVYCSGPLADARAPNPANYDDWGIQNFRNERGDNVYEQTFGFTCGQEIAEHWKTGFYFSCFWVLSALYFPFGLIHRVVTKERKYSRSDIQKAWDSLWEDEAEQAPVATTQPQPDPADLAAIAMKANAYEPPPFGGR